MLTQATDGGVDIPFDPFIPRRIDLIAHPFVDGERGRSTVARPNDGHGLVPPLLKKNGRRRHRVTSEQRRAAAGRCADRLAATPVLRGSSPH